jgi:phospholipid transport system substrate-binding protein
MVRYHARLFGILIFLFMLAPVHGAWAGPPSDQLRAGVDRVFKILGDPELEGDKKLNRRRTAIVIRLRRGWRSDPRAALGAANARRTRGVCSPLHRGGPALVPLQGGLARAEKMIVQGEKVDGDGAVVRTTLPLGQGREMPIDYRMHGTADHWQVYDLSIEGISLVGNYRSQFNKIIRTSSYEALVAKFKPHQAEFPTVSVPSGGRAAR